MTKKVSPRQKAETALFLRPRTSALVDRVLADESFLRQIVTACGSPANLLFPQVIAANVKSFQDVLSAHSIRGALHFAHKSNQSDSLLKQMAVSSIAVDVASANELKHALACGFSGARIEATGPKNAEFLYLCLLHDVAINVDSLQELQDIVELRRSLQLGGKTRVLLRLCGFEAAYAQVLPKESRFGICVSQVTDVLAKLSELDDAVELIGFAFHLDSTSMDERLVAIENCLAIFDEALSLGLEPRVLNIGGGFRVNYLADEDDWNRYTTAIQQAALGIGPQVTWQNNYFGLSAQSGNIRGKFNSYGYFESNPGAHFLDDLLNSELTGYGSQKLAAVLRDNMIELWLEPGRALLDQAGLTLARVNGIKTASNGETLVALNMKRQDIAFLDQEVFVDPLLVPVDQESEAADAYKSVYFSGSLCLENDLIFRHKVFMPRLPRVGDILAFVNTAAYMMDFSATNSIMQPPAVRVAVVHDRSGLTWLLDEQYTPVWRFYDRRERCS